MRRVSSQWPCPLILQIHGPFFNLGTLDVHARRKVSTQAALVTESKSTMTPQ